MFKVGGRVGLIGVLLALSGSAWAGEPEAATRAAARKFATEGVAALQQGDAERASEKLEKAFGLLQAPSIALWSARALVGRGLLVEASERYQQAGRLPPLQGNEQSVQLQAQKDAARELTELSPRIPQLVIAVAGAQPNQVRVTIDGKPVSSLLLDEEQLLNPGTHRIVGVRGSDEVERSVTLKEAQHARVVLQFQELRAAAPGAPQSPASAPSSGQPSSAADTSEASGSGKTLAYVALAVGGAGLLTGGVTGIWAMSKRSSLNNSSACEDDKCLSSADGAVHTFRGLRTASTIGFIAGGAFVATGLVLLLTHSASPEARAAGSGNQLALHIAPNGVSLTQSF